MERIIGDPTLYDEYTKGVSKRRECLKDQPDQVVRNTKVEIPNRVVHECPPFLYLKTLTDVDRLHVMDFIDYAASLDNSLSGHRIAVMAVGSSVRPPEERYHPIGDIDLRVLNSAPQNSDERREIIAMIKSGIRKYLEPLGEEVEEEGCTVESRMVWGLSGGNKELLPYIDWYNNDPSFTVRFKEGLRLQLSISGVDNPALQRYLELERKNNDYFSALLEP